MELGKAKCINCEKEFDKKTKHHVFCNRACFLAHRYSEMKKSMADSRPSYRCLNCSSCVFLGFNPLKKWKLWASFSCPVCGKTPQETDYDKLTITQTITLHYVTIHTTVMN